MAGLIKELLLDYGLNRLPIDIRSDISTTISSLVNAGVFKYYELTVLDRYISGYDVIEIAGQLNTTTDRIESDLIRIVKAIETASGYTDTNFVHKYRRRYTEAKLTTLSLFLIKHGQRFYSHETPIRS